MRLVWSNDGQGVRVEWISDTQTFAITGYSKEPDGAVMLSRNVHTLFLVITQINSKTLYQNCSKEHASESGAFQHDSR